jgi:hypothetical protein
MCPHSLSLLLLLLVVVVVVVLWPHTPSMKRTKGA